MTDGRFLRVIRRKEVLALSFGAMIGWSWVALTGNWIAGAGSIGAIIAFLFGGVVVVFAGKHLEEFWDSANRIRPNLG